MIYSSAPKRKASFEPDWRAGFTGGCHGPEEHGHGGMLGPADELPGDGRVLVGVPGVLKANEAIFLQVPRL